MEEIGNTFIVSHHQQDSRVALQDLQFSIDLETGTYKLPGDSP